MLDILEPQFFSVLRDPTDSGSDIVVLSRILNYPFLDGSWGNWFATLSRDLRNNFSLIRLIDLGLHEILKTINTE